MVRARLFILLAVVAAGCASAPPPEPTAPVEGERYYRVVTETKPDANASRRFDDALDRIERRWVVAAVTSPDVVSIPAVAEVHSAVSAEPGR